MKVWHFVWAILVAETTIGPGSSTMAQTAPCDNEVTLSSFETPDVTDGFAAIQSQRGSVTVRSDPHDPANTVAVMTAGPKSSGRVGKADLIHRFDPVPRGGRVRMAARVMVPEGAPLNSVILMDLECASCGLEGNPGIRLYLRDGRLRVDRSKIGLQDAFLPSVGTRLEPGRWHDLVWDVVLGDDAEGRSVVTLDRARVMDAHGTTVLLQRVVSQFEDTRVTEAVDRFQVGVTANSNPVPATAFMDDIRFCSGR